VISERTKIVVISADQPICTIAGTQIESRTLYQYVILDHTYVKQTTLAISNKFGTLYDVPPWIDGLAARELRG
jgi:hypothetical protein